MFKLNINDFQNVLPLLKKEKHDFATVQAVIEKKLEGDIYVDDIENIKTAFIISKINWVYLIGNQDNQSFNDELLNFIEDNLMKYRDHFVWCGLNTSWQSILNELLGDKIKNFPRMNFVFDKQVYDKQTVHPTLPDGFEIKMIDKNLINKASSFFSGIKMFWNTENNFLENGIGFCALHNNEIVSICQSCVLLSDNLEFDIFTHKDFRRLNLGYFTAKPLIDYCIHNNLQLHWDCTIVNIPSYKLAQKLGLKENQEYSCYFLSKDF